MFRKLKKMSLDELASRIYKSKSVLSKYELGESVFDMNTLYNIAAALDIEPAQLLTPLEARSAPHLQRYGLFANNVLYTYMMVRDHSYHMMRGIIMFSGDESGAVNYYFQMSDYEHYTDCKALFFGKAECFPNGIQFFLRNQVNPADYMVIAAPVRMSNQRSCIGMMMTSSYITNEPGALKILITASPLKDETAAKDMLIISKEDYASIKRSNILGYQSNGIDVDLLL